MAFHRFVVRQIFAEKFAHGLILPAAPAAQSHSNPVNCGIIINEKEIIEQFYSKKRKGKKYG